MRTAIDEQLERAINNLSERDAWIYATQNIDVAKRIRDWVISQLDEGVNEDDQIIGYYSPINAQLKGRLTYDLKDTGYFRSTISTFIFGDTITINADAQKPDGNLFEKYGTKIIGLTDENMAQLTDIVLEEYITYALGILRQY